MARMARQRIIFVFVVVWLALLSIVKTDEHDERKDKRHHRQKGQKLA
jgi:hypothetical protein